LVKKNENEGNILITSSFRIFINISKYTKVKVKSSLAEFEAPNRKLFLFRPSVSTVDVGAHVVETHLVLCSAGIGLKTTKTKIRFPNFDDCRLQDIFLCIFVLLLTTPIRISPTPPSNFWKNILYSGPDMKLVNQFREGEKP